MGTLLAEGSALTKMWIPPPVKRGAQEKRGWGKRKSQKTDRKAREHHLLGMMQTLQTGTHTAVIIFPRSTQGQTSQQLIIHLGGTLWGGSNDLWATGRIWKTRKSLSSVVVQLVGEPNKFFQACAHTNSPGWLHLLGHKTKQKDSRMGKTSKEEMGQQE